MLSSVSGEHDHWMLCGFPGAGKTTVGRAVARRSARPFVDLDERVQRLGGAPIPELIRRRGEAAFRELEAEALARLRGLPASVVALGGGCLEHGPSLRLVRSIGRLFWLDVSLAVALSRLEIAAEVRPLLLGPDGHVDGARAESLYVARAPTYAAEALRIDATATVDEVAREIVAEARSGVRGTPA